MHRMDICIRHLAVVLLAVVVLPCRSQETVPNAPISNGNRFSIEKNDSIWAPSDNGLLHWTGLRWSTLSPKIGLPCDWVTDSVAAAKGRWLSLHCGLAFLSADQIKSWERDPAVRLSIESFNATPFSPSATVTTDGRAWFVTSSGLEMVDLGHQPVNHLPPPIHIEQLIADNVVRPASKEIQIPALTRTLQIDYAGLSFVTPQKMHFRYRLSGVDRDWQDVATRRQAFYMNLRPGSYLFRVVASNNDGVWNMQGDSLRVTIPLKFYQTRWFLVLVIAIGLAVIMAIFVNRFQVMRDLLQAQLRERLVERDRIARELHDTLLQGLHGVMLRLEAGVRMIAPGEESRAILEDALNRADGVIIEGRRSIQHLRAEEDVDLSIGDQFKRLLEEFSLGNGMQCEVVTAGIPRMLNPVAHQEIFSIGREAIVNAFQYAKASTIVVELTFGKRHLQFICRDDGIGISPEIQMKKGVPGHWGIIGMRERAQRIRSSFDIRRIEPRGTSVKLVVPAHCAYLQKKWALFGAFLGPDAS